MTIETKPQKDVTLIDVLVDGFEKKADSRWHRPGASHRVSPGSWPDFARIADSGARERCRQRRRQHADQSVMYGNNAAWSGDPIKSRAKAGWSRR